MSQIRKKKSINLFDDEWQTISSGILQSSQNNLLRKPIFYLFGGNRISQFMARFGMKGSNEIRKSWEACSVCIYSPVTRSSGPVYCSSHSHSASHTRFSGLFWERLQNTHPYLKFRPFFSLVIRSEFKRTKNQIDA